MTGAHTGIRCSGARGFDGVLEAVSCSLWVGSRGGEVVGALRVI
jgi:hypothetical protein